MNYALLNVDLFYFFYMVYIHNLVFLRNYSQNQTYILLYILICLYSKLMDFLYQILPKDLVNIIDEYSGYKSRYGNVMKELEDIADNDKRIYDQAMRELDHRIKYVELNIFINVSKALSSLSLYRKFLRALF